MTVFRPDSTALCAQINGDDWFQEKGERDKTATAKAVCGRCPLLDPCREYALTIRGLAGVWGGTSPADRRKLQDELGLDTEPVLQADRHYACGTEAGYKRHVRHGETACLACNDSNNYAAAYRKRLRTKAAS